MASRLVLLSLLALAAVIAQQVAAAPTALAKRPSDAEARGEIAAILKYLNTKSGSGANLVEYKILAEGLAKEKDLLAAFYAALRKGIKFTIFAPTDGAFRRLNTTGLKCPPSSAQAFSVHILPGNRVRALDAIYAPVFSSLPTLLEGYPVVKLQLQNIPGTGYFINRIGTLTANKKGVFTKANVIRPDAYVSDRVVVHGIDRVLLPQLTKC